MNILIGIPSKDNKIDIECAVSLGNLDWDGHNITYTHCQGAGIYGVAQARNNLVQQAIDGGFDKLLMVDGDMIVPEDAIIHLLEPDVPIVTGVARYKNDSMRCPLFRKTTDREGQASWKWDEIPAGRFEIDSGGVACAMISVEMLRRQIRRPWFIWEERANGTYVGEDIHFYEEVKRAGITPYADGRVRCGHIGRKIYD